MDYALQKLSMRVHIGINVHSWRDLIIIKVAVIKRAAIEKDTIGLEAWKRYARQREWLIRLICLERGEAWLRVLIHSQQHAVFVFYLYFYLPCPETITLFGSVSPGKCTHADWFLIRAWAFMNVSRRGERMTFKIFLSGIWLLCRRFEKSPK